MAFLEAAFHFRVRLPGSGIRRAALAIALVLPALATRVEAAGTTPPRGAPVVSSADEKQRQPKTPPEEPKTKSKKPATPPDEPRTNISSDDDTNDIGFWASCIGDCFTACADGVFENMLDAMFGGKKAAPALALADSSSAFGADSSWLEEPYTPHEWAKLDVGYLRAYTPGDSIVLRQSASAPDSMVLPAGMLPDGARVLVTDTQESSFGLLLKVRAVDEPGPEGWVQAKSVREQPDGPPPQEEILAADSLSDTAPAATPARPSSWALANTIGFADVDNPLLATEYEYGGPVFEIEYLQWFGTSPIAGLGVGFRDFTGYPKVEYAGSVEIDVPKSSAFEMPYAVLEFGQRLVFPSRFRLGYMVGPVAAYVHEEAEIDVLDAGTRQKLGERQEVLDRWTWGGGGMFWLGWKAAPAHEVAVRFRMFGLAWDGRRERSLTSDYTEEPLLFYDVAFTYTHTTR